MCYDYRTKDLYPVWDLQESLQEHYTKETADYITDACGVYEGLEEDPNSMRWYLDDLLENSYDSKEDKAELTCRIDDVIQAISKLRSKSDAKTEALDGLKALKSMIEKAVAVVI